MVAIYHDSGIAFIGMLSITEMHDVYEPTYGWSISSGMSAELQTAGVKSRMFYIENTDHLTPSRLSALLAILAKTEATRRSLRISELAYSYFDL